MSGIPGRLPRLPLDGHKGTAGRVLVCAGSRDMPGAAVLVARSAQRAGAGLVVVGRTHHSLAQVLAVAAPEAIQTSFEGLVDWTKHDPHARLVGPGLEAAATTRALVELALVCDHGIPIVVDAGALEVYGDEPESFARGRAPRILTPHPGEAARLLGRKIGGEESERIEAAQELALRSNSVVCLKGAGTLVVAPDGEPWRSDTGNAGMATAGAGDVLAGTLVAFVASARAGGWDVSLEAVTRLAVWAHGRAGDLALSAVGERGLIASDLIDFLPAAQRELEA